MPGKLVWLCPNQTVPAAMTGVISCAFIPFLARVLLKGMYQQTDIMNRIIMSQTNRRGVGHVYIYIDSKYILILIPVLILFY